jgi:hypothetical protein
VPRQWLDYLPALEKAISVISVEIEALQFQGNWSPYQRTEGLQALQQLRHGWTQEKVVPGAFVVLRRLGNHEAFIDNISFRASLESIEQWGIELEEERQGSHFDTNEKIAPR